MARMNLSVYFPCNGNDAALKTLLTAQETEVLRKDPQEHFLGTCGHILRHPLTFTAE